MLSLTARLQRQLAARYGAHAGVQRMIGLLHEDATQAIDGPTEPWFHDGPALQGRQGDVSFQVLGVADEERKLNLNTMPAPVWSRLCQSLGGLREPEASAIGQAIEDWRDADREAQRDGAESFYYTSLYPPYEAKDGPFETVEELQLVKGMTPELFVRLKPWLTVYGSGQVNLNTAEETVLSALGLSEPGVFGLMAYRAGEDGVVGNDDDRTLVSVAGAAVEFVPYMGAEDLAHLQQLIQADLLTVGGEAFSFTVQAQTEAAESAVTLDVVLDREGRLLRWGER